MARLTDPERLAAFQAALLEWKCSGVITYTPRADAWIRANLPRCTQMTINEMMYKHVRDGGEIDEVPEALEEYRRNFEFHHDFRIPFRNKVLYVETRLRYNPFDPRNDPAIWVVNVHWA